MIDYEERLQSMLNRVKSDVDKREGSLIYDALGPCAYALTEQEFILENFVDLLLADTAEGEYLDRAVWPHVFRKEATAAERRMITSGVVELGTRWGIQDLVYVVTGIQEDNCYIVTCETAGVIGNQYSGDMSPVSAVTGIQAVLEGVVTPGTEEEEDEALRERFYQKVRYPVTSGNAYYYRDRAMSVAGVGSAKVFPLDAGPGTVSVYIVNENCKVDEALETVVSEYINEQKPIGASVSVFSPTQISVNVSADVTIDGSAAEGDIAAEFKDALAEYLARLVKENYSLPVTEVTKPYRVSLAQVGNLLLNVSGVTDYENLVMNGTSGNVAIGAKEIPVVGLVDL